jgi:hypothetical protein
MSAIFLGVKFTMCNLVLGSYLDDVQSFFCSGIKQPSLQAPLFCVINVHFEANGQTREFTNHHVDQKYQTNYTLEQALEQLVTT